MRQFKGQTLLVATHNQGKLDEIKDLLAGLGVSVLGAAAAGLPEPEETGTTFVENARVKALAAACATGVPALADDSGIEIDALARAPGICTSDWAETPGGRDYVLAMARIQEELARASSPPPWTARFCCTFVLAWPDRHEEIFEGKVEGQLVWPTPGKFGYGYDPIFQPDGYDITFGQMGRVEKNRISHRADAFQKLMAVFEDA